MNNVPLNILYLANARMPTGKAHGFQIMKMCEAFADNGAEVELVVPRRWDMGKEDIFEFYGVRKNFRIVQVWNIDLFGLGRFGYWVRTFSYAVRAFVFALRRKGSIVYSRDDLPLMFLGAIGYPFFYEIHTNRYSAITRRVLKKALGLVTISGGLCKFFKERGVPTNRFLVSPDAVDLELFAAIPDNKNFLRKELDLPSEREIVAYIGKYKTMGKKKGVGELIVVFQTVLRVRPHAFLLLVGIDPCELTEVEQLFSFCGVPKDAYQIILHQRHHIAMRYLKAADVLVMNYPNMPHYANFMSPLKLFEYMASGTPVVSTDLPSVREVLHEGSAVLVDPDKREELMHGIIKVLRNPDFAEKIRKGALVDIRHYSWYNRAARIIVFFRDAHPFHEAKTH